jgi:hypothetical protein
MKKRWVVLVLLAVFTVFGCATTPGGGSWFTPQPTPTVCQEFAGPSLLEQYIPDLKFTNTMFKLGLYEISKLDDVKKKDIVEFLDRTESVANNSGTYMQLITEFDWLKGKVGPEIIIIGDDLAPLKLDKTPIAARDVCYVKYAVADARAKVLPWIKAKQLK